jgi:23S rRNA pseudouridine2605 synthase
MQDRLQKILAHAGIASRRSAEKMILEGRVRVNGKVISEMGVKADPEIDVITLDGKRLRRPGLPVYILLHKPKGVLSTRLDPRGRRTVIDLIDARLRDKVYPVGRLDYGSEGLLILTNDGEFTHFMTRAGGAEKVYRVKVSGTPPEASLDRLRKGIRLTDTRTAPCAIRVFRTGANSWYEITLLQGRNRQIRRMFEAIGHSVLKLRRTRIGFLEDSKLESGVWRHLTDAEVDKFYRRYGNRTTEDPPVKKPGRTSPARVTKKTRRKTAVGKRS